MKSIKEKASEYSFVNKGIDENGNHYEDYSVVKLDGFIAGANYVLDVVECILEDNKLSDCEEICNELIALIEQLKKF